MWVARPLLCILPQRNASELTKTIPTFANKQRGHARVADQGFKRAIEKNLKAHRYFTWSYTLSTLSEDTAVQEAEYEDENGAA
jgi:imidazoleglycerol phosphate synthase glutamine amidotransferase subunit HisH